MVSPSSRTVVRSPIYPSVFWSLFISSHWAIKNCFISFCFSMLISAWVEIRAWWETSIAAAKWSSFPVWDPNSPNVTSENNEVHLYERQKLEARGLARSSRYFRRRISFHADSPPIIWPIQRKVDGTIQSCQSVFVLHFVIIIQYLINSYFHFCNYTLFTIKEWAIIASKIKQNKTYV